VLYRVWKARDYRLIKQEESSDREREKERERERERKIWMVFYYGNGIFLQSIYY
jgi:hypothetical protein